MRRTIARPAQPDRRGSELAARAIVRRIFGEQAQRFLFEPALEPPGKRIVRSAQRQPAAIQPRAARCIAAPVDGKLATAVQQPPLIRRIALGRDLGELRGEPVAPRMGEGSRFGAARPVRQGDPHRAAIRCQPQRQPPRPPVAGYLDRKRAIAELDHRLQRVAAEPVDHVAPPSSSSGPSPSPQSTTWCSSGPASSSRTTRPATDTPARTTPLRSPLSR